MSIPGSEGRDSPVVMARRIRAAALIALVALPVFGFADAWTPGHDTLGLVATKLCQLALVVWTYVASTRARTWDRVQAVAGRFVAGLIVTSAAAAVARGQLTALPLILVIAVVAPPVLVPWGTRQQVMLVGIAAAA